MGEPIKRWLEYLETEASELLLLFVPAPWHWLASPLPTWWTLLGYSKLAEGNAGGWGWMLLGATVLLSLNLGLARRLSRRND